jgi:LacI family transcriptional regulator
MRRYEQTTLKQIAAELKLSVSTVSRVLAGKGDQYRISAQTADRVKAEAKRTGFVPNQIASALRLKRTHTVGLIIPDISNPFFASVARQIEMEAARRGYFIILCDSRDSTDAEVEYLKLLQSRSVDGLIISPVGRIGAHLRGLRGNGMPVVLIDRYFPDLEAPYVTSDNYGGAYEAVTHLIEHGHTRIACVRGIEGSSTADDRLAGYRAALEAAGIDYDPQMVAGDDFSENSGYAAAQVLLKSRTVKPSAIFSQGILITFGVLRVLDEKNLAIPRHISLVSFDDHYYTSFLATPLTTVAQDKESIGRDAVKLLFSQLDQGVEKITKGIHVPTFLIKRKSVAYC